MGPTTSVHAFVTSELVDGCALLYFEGNEEAAAKKECYSSDFAVSRSWGIYYTCSVADLASFFLYTCGQYNGLLLGKKKQPQNPTPASFQSYFLEDELPFQVLLC